MPPFRELLSMEQALWERGCRWVAGVDEAGRGPLAGPVVAAAVVLSQGCGLEGLDDSKRLSATQREKFYRDIHETAVAVATGVVDSATIDRENILEATLRAMLQAVEGLRVRPDHVLVDGPRGPKLPLPVSPVVHGDSRCACIAAASVVAKVTRDRMMVQLDAEFPQYKFAKHKGYPTREHVALLQKYGPCSIHRRSFRPVMVAAITGLPDWPSCSSRNCAAES